MKIAVTGASGFVGKNLVSRLIQNPSYEIMALSRSKISFTDQPNLAWRHCDIFSLSSTMNALKDADIAIYLVHSMLPSARLYQGHFSDLDLHLADNFAKACVANNIKQIIYLGGIAPDGKISKHLSSRLEVEDVFYSTSIPTTILRSGMVVGNGGSSFEILKNLVLNLPLMILPSWTKNKTQVIYIDDLINIIDKSIFNKDFLNRSFNLVTGEDLTYEDLLRKTAKFFNKKIWMQNISINSTQFSKLWVTIFGNSNYDLVSPLIDSLLCNLAPEKNDDIIQKIIKYSTYDDMLKANFDTKIPHENSLAPQKMKFKKFSFHNTVRSIQRLPSLPNKDAKWIAEEYMRWLPLIFRTLIYIETEPHLGQIYFKAKFFPRPLLILNSPPEDSDVVRQKFLIVGGILSKTTNTGWLEFRQIANKKFTLSEIHDFIPSLPWFIYIITQAQIHKWVMNAFSKHLIKHQNFK